MKRPAFQFYPADWRKDANLRRCSPAARGVWMDVLCVLHDSETYGIVHWPLKELALAAGCSMAHLREIVEKRVIKGCDKGPCEPLIYTPRHGRKDGPSVTLVQAQNGPIWYSSRFVRDEYVRTIRGEGSRFCDTNGDAPKDAPNPPFGDGPSSSSASSTSVEIQGSVCVNGIPEPPHTHTPIPSEFRKWAMRCRPDLNPDAVWKDFCTHYPPDKRTENRWDKWLAREDKPGTTGPNGTGLDPDSKGAVTALGIELGLGQWDELKEPFPAYKARVRQAQFHQTPRGA